MVQGPLSTRIYLAKVDIPLYIHMCLSDNWLRLFQGSHGNREKKSMVLGFHEFNDNRDSCVHMPAISTISVQLDTDLHIGCSCLAIKTKTRRLTIQLKTKTPRILTTSNTVYSRRRRVVIRFDLSRPVQCLAVINTKARIGACLETPHNFTKR